MRFIPLWRLGPHPAPLLLKDGDSALALWPGPVVGILRSTHASVFPSSDKQRIAAACSALDILFGSRRPFPYRARAQLSPPHVVLVLVSAVRAAATLHLLGPHLDPDVVEYVPGSSSISIAPNFATNHLDNQLPSSCRQEIERFAKDVQEKIIELVVLHQCKGVKEGYPIDHVVEDGGSIAFAIDGLVKAFAKDPGTADISRHTFELVMPYLNKDVVDAKPVPVSGTSELYVGLTAKFVEEELGQYLPLPCWFPKVVFGFAVSAVGLWWAAVTLCAKCAWEYPKFILSIFVVWLFVKKVCECIEKFVTMPIAVYIIDGWVKERLNPLPVGESLCKAILRDEIGAEYFRFRGHRYLIGTRDWFYDRAWGAFEEEFDDSRFNTEYLETEGFEVPMAHWVRV